MADFGEMLGGLFGGGGTSNPGAVDPNTGLSEAQKYQTYSSGLAQLGGLLMAAGQKQMPADRAKYLAQLGSVPGAMNQQTTQMMQQKLLAQNTKLAETKAQQQTDMMKLLASPEFKQQLAGLPPQMQPIAQAAMVHGDLNTLTNLVQQTMPKPDAQGNLWNPVTQTYTNLQTGLQYKVGENGAVSMGEAGAPAAAGAPAGPQVTGEEFLKTIPPSLASEVKLYAEGKLPMSQVMRDTPKGRQIMSLLMRYDPSGVDSIVSGNRASMVKDIQSGDLGKQRRAIDTFIEHSAVALDAAKGLDNSAMPTWNAIANKVLTETGDPRVTKLQSAMIPLMGEAAKIFKGTATEGELNRLEAVMNSSQSPEQLRAALDQLTNLVAGRAIAIDQTTQSALGKTFDPDKHGAVSPEMKKLLDKQNADPWGKQNAPATPAAPAAAPNRAALEAEARRRGLIQ
jgi:hypothetical protein